MNITVHARHMNITEAIRQYTEEKASKLQRYFDRLTSVEVIMDLDGGVPAVEVVAKATHNSTFIGRHRGEDMYGCIDSSMHKVEEQIRRHKDKVRNHKGPSHEAQTEQASPVQEEPRQP